MINKFKIALYSILFIILTSAICGVSAYLIIFNNSHAYYTNTIGSEVNLPGYVGDLINEQGTGINPLTYDALIKKIGDLGASGEQKASGINQDTIVFKMGEVNGNSIFWQVVYRTDDYITVWMTQPYTTSIFNTYDNLMGILTDENFELIKKHFSKIHPNISVDDYIQMGYYYGVTNYSQSYLRDMSLAIYYDLIENGSFPFIEEITVSPSVMENETQTNWQSSQEATKINDETWVVTNGLAGYPDDDSVNNPFNDEVLSCMDDKFWIPSYYELFNAGESHNNLGLWGLNNGELGFGGYTL